MPATAAIKTRSLQPESLSADTDRLINDILLQGGVVDVAGLSCKVAQDTGANMQIRVGSGTAGDKAVIRRSGRVYIGEHQNATQTYAIAASDPSNPRIDLVVYRTYDNEADSSGNTWSDFEVIQGTPAASPTVPALPAGAISLAEVRVNAGVTAIINADITDRRAKARSGGVAPAGELAHAEVTADQASISGVTDLTGLTVTVTVVANRRIRITAAGDISATDTGGVPLAQIKEGGTVLGRWSRWNCVTSNEQRSDTRSVVITPSAASHTYKLTLERAAGTGTVGLRATSTNPAFILVEDLGPA